MKICDVYIALLHQSYTGTFIRSDGTCIEIGWASAMKKPIILIGNNILCDKNSHLIRGLIAITQVVFFDLVDLEQDVQAFIRELHKLVN